MSLYFTIASYELTILFLYLKILRITRKKVVIAFKFFFNLVAETSNQS